MGAGGALIAPWEAVGLVFRALPFEAVAAQEMYLGYRAIERELLVVEDLGATASQLGLDAREVLAMPHSYTDRSGEYRSPFGVAVHVARHCCERFGRDVLRYVGAEEDALRRAIVSGYYSFPTRRHGGSEEGGGSEIRHEWAEKWLGEQAPIFALIREWCGQEAVEELGRCGGCARRCTGCGA